MIKKPCLNCGELTRNSSRCDRCTAVREARRNERRPHYKGDYRRRAKEVRATAIACWICGEGARPNDPFTADHVATGEPNSPLLPAHRSCNSRRGAREHRK
jgi:hypothetical protein